MAQSRSIISLLLLILPLTLLPLTQAHIAMDSPCGRGNPTCYGRYGRLDYDSEAPLNFEDDPDIGGPFPCKGLPAGPSVGRYRAGSTMSVRLSGSDSHDGGHCQFTLSPDNGRTWVVLRTVTENCLRGRGGGPYTYDIKLPSTTPGGRNIFAWTFVNREGNEEFYMSCADVEVDGPKDGTVTGPELLVFRMSPGQTQGRPYVPLGEWKYGGDNGVGRLDNRRIITAGRRGRVAGRPDRPKQATKQSPKKQPTREHSRDTDGKRQRPAKRPTRRQKGKRRRPSHDENEEEDCEETCAAEE